MRPTSQFRYWLVTAPEECYNQTLFSDKVKYIKGQLEQGTETDYRHWQMVVYFKLPITIVGFKRLLIESYGENGNRWHLENQTQAAEEYVWKEDTAIEGTQFELGT